MNCSSDQLKEFFLEVQGLSINHDRIIKDDNENKWILETTTGSTGKPFTVLKSPSEKFIESKYLFDQRKKIYPEVSISNGFLLIAPVDEYLKGLNYRGNNDENMPLVFHHLLQKKPKWILLTTLLLRKLYKYVVDTDQLDRLKELDIKFIETTSQALDREEKKEIEEAFHTRIIDQYGCKETWNIAYECSAGHLHINDRYLLVDLVDDDGKLIDKEGETGQVVLTSFLHKSFPLIKYYLGDYACIEKGICTCGQSTPRLMLKGGRNKDRLIGSSYFGTEIFRKVMRFIYFKCPDLTVNRIKIIQTDVGKLEVYAEVDSSCREKFEKTFIQTFRFLLGNEAEYQMEIHPIYPFVEDPHCLKNEIFENRICRI